MPILARMVEIPENLKYHKVNQCLHCCIISEVIVSCLKVPMRTQTLTWSQEKYANLTILLIKIATTWDWLEVNKILFLLPIPKQLISLCFQTANILRRKKKKSWHLRTKMGAGARKKTNPKLTLIIADGDTSASF